MVVVAVRMMVRLEAVQVGEWIVAEVRDGVRRLWPVSLALACGCGANAYFLEGQAGEAARNRAITGL